VARPELAQTVRGVGSLLTNLAERYALVAVVSGRPSGQVRELIAAPGVEVFGLYGLESQTDGAGSEIRVVLPDLERISREVAGSWVEDKGESLAVHYRAAPDPSAAERELGRRLGDLARERGLAVMPGKMVLELAPSATPGKGVVVVRECRARALEGCLYAGDDRADLAAFGALDELRAEGLETLKVAVRSEETPEEVVAAADLVVERPAGLTRLLAQL
jgi:trehalose 6-phosphate phosphatase